MSIKALQDYTYYSKYARYSKNQGRRETWQEACDRVKEMHLSKYPQAGEEIEWAFDVVKQRRVLGSQRALQFGGEPCLRKNARIYNCTVSFCDRIRFFQECFWLLLCGCGTGFSVQKHHVAKLPEFLPCRLEGKELKRKVFRIPDTIEGWADALGVLLATYFPHPEFAEWEGYEVEFDFSGIRPEGSILASGVGKAPGPQPLMRSLKQIKSLLSVCVHNGMKRLRPLDAYDLVMHASDAVLSGGVRRSATIAIFSPDDEDMAKAKTGNWFNENPQRARSNNSACLVRSETSRDDFMKFIGWVKEFGEPGFYFTDSTEQLPNPCFHKDTRLVTSKGLVKIYDLYKEGNMNEVVIDRRAGKGDLLNMENLGTDTAPATKVLLTQQNANIYELETTHGHSIKVTANHEFPTQRGRLQLKDMVEGDTILLQSAEGQWGSFGTFEQGIILGLIVGDGTISVDDQEAFIDVWEDDFDQLEYIQAIVNDEISDLPSISNGGRTYDCLNWVDQAASENKNKKRIGGRRLFRFLTEVIKATPELIKERLEENLWQGSRDFVRGFLQGFFFSDGGPQLSGHKKKATLSYRLNQSNKSLLQEVQVILNNFGIVSRVALRRKEGNRLLPDGKGGKKEYFCKANYELIINRPNAATFDSLIGWMGRKRSLCATLWQLRGSDCRKPERFVTKVKSISYHSNDDVFCLKQERTNTVIAGGCVAGQCVEIGMWPVCADTGESGWQMCNLCEINGRKIKCKEDFAVAARGAAIIGTLQAGYTDFDYLGPVTKRIVEREALLGVSITGMMDNPDVIFDPKTQQEMAQLILETNEWFAKKIGINPCARATCVKPAGTTSCLLGTSSGIHPHHAKRYFRRVQANRNENVLNYFKGFNPHAVEKSVWSANGTDEVITFCVEVPAGAKTKNDLSAVELLSFVKSTQENWVNYGKREDRCTQPWLSHNVSNTINVRPEEWDDVADYIYKNRGNFAGVSLLPASGDLDYPQAPFCNVLTPREIMAEYGDGCLLASGLIVDGLHAYGDLWVACDHALGIRPMPAEPKEPNGNSTLEDHRQWAEDHAAWEVQTDWVRRIQQFAERYCEGNVRKCTYLLKHVNNWKTWLDLTRDYKDVDYADFMESEDNTKIQETIACAGGKCELNFG